MNEAETRAEYIDPALKAAGWGVVEGSNILCEYSFLMGSAKGKTKRGSQLTADYVLVYRNTKLAVIEAKGLDKDPTEGVIQAKELTAKMAVRFAYSTNGKTIHSIDMQTGKESKLTCYPTPAELWNKTFNKANAWRDRFSAVPFEGKEGSQPRYYQTIAIDRALEAIADKRQRLLLTLATGTGKTYIAFQIVWKLFHSRWNLSRKPTRRPRVLLISDRTVLAEQTFRTFSAFPGNDLVRISPADIRINGKVPKNGSIFFTVFQTLMSGPSKGGKPAPYYRQYPKDFFDFIVIDECHRGVSNDVIKYFAAAVQLGITAMPNSKKYAATYDYFGEPIFSYSLKDGLNDGFLRD